MRFVILSQYFPPEVGAPQLRLAAFARELTKMGHDVEVVTAFPNHPTGRVFPGYQRRVYVRETCDGVRVHRTWVYPATGAGVRRVANYASFALSSTVGLARVRRADYIFVESPPPLLSIPAWAVSKMWRSRVILNVADLWPDSIEQMGIWRNRTALALARYLEDWSYRKAAFVTAVTEGIRESLINQKGVPSRKILFLPNGVDLEQFKPRPVDVDLCKRLLVEGRLVVLYAGTLGFAQGLDTVLDAARVIQTTDPRVHFVFVGDGSDRVRLEARARDMKLGNVTFLPPVSPGEVAQLYSIAFAGLVCLKALPVFDGARPSKMFPAMASGKPVIYCGEGEGARLLKTVNAGVTVEPGNSLALARAIAGLAENPGFAAELGRNGRRYAEVHLSWSALVERWLDDLIRKDSDSGAQDLSTVFPSSHRG